MSAGKITVGVGIGGVLGLIVWWLSKGTDRSIKNIEQDTTATPGKTGYKRVDTILAKLRAVALATGIPLGLMVGWIAKESGGKLAIKPQPGPGDTSMDERGYFQLTPEESKTLGLDHERLSIDSDYSIDAGPKIIRHYQSTINDLMDGVTSAGTSTYWRLVKLAHSMGGAQVKKIVTAAKAAGQAGSWEDLEQFALGMKISGPQPKKWFPFVDDSREHTKDSSVYRIGQPFGFGSETVSVVGAGHFDCFSIPTTRHGLDVFTAGAG